MKTIGLLGGMSWESTATYYRLLNEGVKQRLGGLHSAPIVLHSVDFAPIAELQKAGDWAACGRQLSAAAQGLQQAGAELILICTNTMHIVAPQISAAVSVPLLHIGDAIGARLQQDGIGKVGLLGTAFTMEQSFYKERLTQQFGLQVLVPDAAQRAVVHQVIYDELCRGRFEAASRQQFVQVINDLVAAGAQAVILGCT
jgi:aspartate racemase